MKIATWNINSIRIRLDLLAKFCATEQPDIVALQETKVTNDLFPKDFCNNIGYKHVIFSGEKSYNGVAILSKFPIEQSFVLNLYNDQARHIAAKINDIELHNFYVPAGGDEPDPAINPKFKHKLGYIKLMREWFANNRSKNDKIILVGDLNIAPHQNDVWSTKQLKNVVSHTDTERQMLTENINEFGFVDAARHLHPEDEKLYSWWSYRSPNWQKSNKGRRLDHIWLSNSLENNLKNLEFCRNMRAEPRPSDHVPVVAQLK